MTFGKEWVRSNRRASFRYDSESFAHKCLPRTEVLCHSPEVHIEPESIEAQSLRQHLSGRNGPTNSAVTLTKFIFQQILLFLLDRASYWCYVLAVLIKFGMTFHFFSSVACSISW
jgi:hypothetical protein